MLPADERFEPGERAARDVEHRLVVHAQLAALDGAVQRAAGAEVVDGAVMRRDVEHLGAVAAVFLRAVHRGVGVAQEGLGRVALPVGHRDPDRDGDEHFPFDEGNRFGDHFRDALGDVLGGVHAGDVQAQHRELVATEARHDVVGTHRAAQAVGDRDEQPVSRRVPEAVVHHLEAVEVEEQDRHPAVHGGGTRQLSAEPLHEQRAVGQAGERVVDRLVREGLATRLPLGDVFHLAHEVERVALHVAHERPARVTPRRGGRSDG